MLVENNRFLILYIKENTVVIVDFEGGIYYV